MGPTSLLWTQHLDRLRQLCRSPGAYRSLKGQRDSGTTTAGDHGRRAPDPNRGTSRGIHNPSDPARRSTGCQRVNDHRIDQTSHPINVSVRLKINL